MQKLPINFRVKGIIIQIEVWIKRLTHFTEQAIKI